MGALTAVSFAEPSAMLAARTGHRGRVERTAGERLRPGGAAVVRRATAAADGEASAQAAGGRAAVQPAR
eukprot:COSAG04_NODE_20174_length_399_cov_0.653333_1_plen_68_part_10